MRRIRHSFAATAEKVYFDTRASSLRGYDGSDVSANGPDSWIPDIARTAIMRSRDILLLVLASLFLAGFDSQKTEVMIKRCVERGDSEETCRCGLNIQEEMFGPKFMEAMYFEAIGDLTGYEHKLLELAAENPKAILQADPAEFEARVKERCAPRQ